MKTQFGYADFLRTSLNFGAAWTGLAMLAYFALYYSYAFLFFSAENQTVFGIERLLTCVLLLIAGIVINGAIGLCLGSVLALISYAIFPRPQEVERIYRISLMVATIIAILVVGSYVWIQALCILVGAVYIEAASFIMMLNFLIFGSICYTCSTGYLNRGKVKTSQF
jgi:hypothetical protein